MRRLLLNLVALWLTPVSLCAWSNGELLIWMDPDRGQAIEPLVTKFQKDLGIKVTIESPPNLTTRFAIAAQAGRGPDIVIWAHDKIGEWSEGGLISPVDVSDEYKGKFFPKAWEAVMHDGTAWGYPIAMETVTLIYNKKLLVVQPPTELS
jgi:maltose/maltodextrin transport system substrate-binding protein